MKGWFIQAVRQVVATKPPKVYISPWVAIPCDTAQLDAAGDAIGPAFTIPVPVSGIIQSASLLDRDDEKTQIDVPLLDAAFTVTATNAAFTLSDLDVRKFIYELQFTTFDDYIDNAGSSIENIGKAYRVPPSSKGSKMGLMYAQGITRATPTIAAGSEPLVRLEILPDEPVD